jgi:hypothetical protein
MYPCKLKVPCATSLFTHTAVRFLMAQSYAGFITFLAWVSNSVPRPPSKRAVALAFINAFSQLGNIAGSYVWPSGWGPTYRSSYAITISTFGYARVLSTLQYHDLIPYAYQLLHSAFLPFQDASPIAEQGVGSEREGGRQAERLPLHALNCYSSTIVHVDAAVFRGDDSRPNVQHIDNDRLEGSHPKWRPVLCPWTHGPVGSVHEDRFLRTGVVCTRGRPCCDLRSMCFMDMAEDVEAGTE